MLSAPAHIPAISVASFGAGFADPDLIFGSAIWILSANSADRPVCSASAITGTNPASDTRLSSWNTAESGMKSCETCTGSAFPNWTDCCVETPIIPDQKDFPHIDTRSPSIDRWIEA